MNSVIFFMVASPPVFAKDMSYYVMPEILSDFEICKRVRHCLLIRNPLKSVLSYHRLDPELRLDEIGLEPSGSTFRG
jgi:hypothetical protein